MSPERILQAASSRLTATTGIPTGATRKAPRRAYNASRPTDLIAPINRKNEASPSNAVLRPSGARLTNEAISSANHQHTLGSMLQYLSTRASTGFRVWGAN